MPVSHKWIPSIIAPATVAAVALIGPVQANAIDLPDRSADELMVLMESGTQVSSFTGIVVTESNLGLPALEFSSMVDEASVERLQERMPEEMADFVPQVIEQNSLTDALELLAGDQRARVVMSEDGVRVQIMDAINERVFVANRESFWAYDYREATAVTGNFPDANEQQEIQDRIKTQWTNAAEQLQTSLTLDISSPQAVAEYVLEKTSDSTSYQVGSDKRIAGRDAYSLIVAPRSDASLIDRIVLHIDAETGMVLQSAVFSTEQDEAAFRIGFESLSYKTPQTSEFSFTPPPGTTITTLPDTSDALRTTAGRADMDELTTSERTPLPAERPQFLGEEWNSVLFVPATDEYEQMLTLLDSQFLEGLVQEIDGGKVFSTPVANAFMADNGDIYIGAVTVETLLATQKQSD
jgi:outer membrane lipoprotein-sorting protein